MTRTIFYTASSLDGYLADEQDSLDWLFTQDQDERGPLSYEEFFAGVGAILTGSTTYVGGGDLAAWLAELGLLDELIVYLAPVTLGAGRPLLPRPLDLRLLELERNRAFACARYEVVGPRRSTPGPASGVP